MPPHATSKGFGAPARDTGAARTEKSKGSTKKKEHARIDGTSSKVLRHM